MSNGNRKIQNRYNKIARVCDLLEKPMESMTMGKWKEKLKGEWILMMPRGFGMYGGGGIVGLILVAVVAYFLIKYLNDNKNVSDTFRKRDDAMDILNERYAKGEIDEEEYTKRKEILKD